MAGKCAGKDRWRHFWGRRNNVIIRWTKFPEPAQAATQGRINPKYEFKSTDVSFIPIFSGSIRPVYTCIISRVRDSTHVLVTLLYTKATRGNQGTLHRYRWFHRSCLALMPSVGCAFCPRIRDLHDKRLVYQREAKYPALVTDINDQPESERRSKSLA